MFFFFFFHFFQIFYALLPPLCSTVEPTDSGEEEIMENLVAANSLLNMDCADTLSLDQHYCKFMQL